MDNNQFQPQILPNINYQPGNAYTEPPRRKHKLVWLWITLGLVGAAGIAAALVFTVFSPIPAAPRNVLILDGSEVMLARGGETVSLGKASYISDSLGTSLNSFLTDNGRILFYLCDVDEETGEGTLMRVEKAGSRAPEEVAQGVCMASVSDDGSRVLYVTGMDTAGGDLMLIDKGQTKRVAQDVVPRNIAFSPSGEYFSFLQANETAGGYEFTVYAGRSAEDIEEADDFKNADGFYLFYPDVLDNGTILYSIWTPGDTDSETRLCACEYGGKPDKLADDGHIIWTDGVVYLYADADDTLYYVDGKGEEEKIVGNYEYYLSAWDKGVLMKDKLLIYQEGSSDNTDNLYSLTLGQSEEKICVADKYSVTAGPALAIVLYTKDGELFVSVSGKNGWEETSMDTKSLQYAFEDSGRYFYYIAAENETDTKGDLYRYDIKSGDKEKLQTDVTGLRLHGNAVYTIDEDGIAYYIDPNGKETQIAEDALELSAGTGGVYIKKEDGDEFSLFFAPLGGAADKIAGGFDQLISYGISIEYQMPLPADVKQALGEMREDAQLLLDLYSGLQPDSSKVLHRQYEESTALAKKLKGRPDVPEEVKDILWDFYFGFWDVEFVMTASETENYTDVEKYIKESGTYLNDAVSAYDAYLAK